MKKIDRRYVGRMIVIYRNGSFYESFIIPRNSDDMMNDLNTNKHRFQINDAIHCGMYMFILNNKGDLVSAYV